MGTSPRKSLGQAGFCVISVSLRAARFGPSAKGPALILNLPPNRGSSPVSAAPNWRSISLRAVAVRLIARFSSSKQSNRCSKQGFRRERDPIDLKFRKFEFQLMQIRNHRLKSPSLSEPLKHIRHTHSVDLSLQIKAATLHLAPAICLIYANGN